MFTVIGGGSLAAILEASTTSTELEIVYWLMPQLVFVFVVCCIIAYVATSSATLNPEWASNIGISVAGDTNFEQLSLSTTPAFWILAATSLKDTLDQDVDYVGAFDFLAEWSDSPTGGTILDLSIHKDETESKYVGTSTTVLTCPQEEIQSLPMASISFRTILLSLKRCSKSSGGASTELADCLNLA